MATVRDLYEILGNLLDNAGKWCRSRVVVTVQTGEGLSVTVADDVWMPIFSNNLPSLRKPPVPPPLPVVRFHGL